MRPEEQNGAFRLSSLSEKLLHFASTTPHTWMRPEKARTGRTSSNPQGMISSTTWFTNTSNLCLRGRPSPIRVQGPRIIRRERELKTSAKYRTRGKIGHRSKHPILSYSILSYPIHSETKRQMSQGNQPPCRRLELTGRRARQHLLTHTHIHRDEDKAKEKDIY